ncbi:MAG TPA: TylF/MycF/NovP-related O-methyltransferase [Rhizomicrobium sp.]
MGYCFVSGRQAKHLPLGQKGQLMMASNPAVSGAAQLYLDLLKRSLTNTIFAIEPDAEGDTLRYVGAAISHYQQSSAVSMLPLARMDNLQNCITDVIADNIPGDFIETGVWRGGATIFMRAVLKVLNVTDRTVWCADSFEGLPEPDPEKFPLEAKSFKSAAMTKYYNHLAVSLEEVQRNFAAYGLLDDKVRFLKGWFKDTLPGAPFETLAIMRLDGDYYESTRDALTNLYDKLSVGGYVIIDDYGEDNWTYCRKAVEEFREQRGITDPLVRVDKPCSFWRKTR